LIAAIVIYSISSLTDSFEIVVALASIFIIAASVLIINGITSFLKKEKVKASINRTVTFTSCIIISNFVVFLFIVGFIVSLIFHSVSSGNYKISGNNGEEGIIFATCYHDSLPVTVNDLIGIDSDNYSTEWYAQESPILAKYTGTQSSCLESTEGLPSLRYTITKVKMHALYDLCFKQLYNDNDDTDDKDKPEGGKRRLVEIDAEPWGANAAYQVYRGDKAEDTYLICCDVCIMGIDAGWQLTNEQIDIIVEKLNGI
jgi:hypothetical protein